MSKTIFIISVCLLVIEAWLIDQQKYTNNSTCKCQNKTLCLPIERKSNKIVAVYSTTNEDWHQYDFSVLTEIIITSKQINPELICLAHSKGVQVHSEVKLTSDVIYETTVQDKWIQEVIRNVKNMNLDGISLNYQEYVPPKKQTLLTAFVKELYRALHTTYQLSYSVQWYLDSEERKLYKELSQFVDYFVVREFDMSNVIQGPPCYPGANAPIYNIMSSELLVLIIYYYKHPTLNE